MKTIGLTFRDLTVAAASSDKEYWGHAVSGMQSNVAVANGAVTGTLSLIESGALATDWGPGHFIALAFSNADSTATGHRVGLVPTEGSGLVALDSDMDAVCKVTDKDAQVLVVESTDGAHVHRQVLDLSGLVLADS